MFQWITIVLAVVAAGALLVGADQVVKYFQSQETQEVPVNNQLNTPPVPPGEPGSAPTAQTFDNRFPGSSNDAVIPPGTEAQSPQTASETAAPATASDPSVNFTAPTNSGDLNLLDSPSEVPPSDSSMETETTPSDDEAIPGLW